jgi:hypothetical protein
MTTTSRFAACLGIAIDYFIKPSLKFHQGLQFKRLIIEYARNNWPIESDGWSSTTNALSLTYLF